MDRQGLCCSFFFSLFGDISGVTEQPLITEMMSSYNENNLAHETKIHELQSEAKQFSQARICPFCKDATWHTTCLTALPQRLRSQRDYCDNDKKPHFLIPKGVSLQSMEICLPSALATESTSRFCSWQAEINGKNLLLNEAVPQRTDAQSHCPSPDLDGVHLGGESTTVINSCWFNKLHNRLQSRPHWSSTQKTVSFRNFPKLCFTETEGR